MDNTTSDYVNIDGVQENYPANLEGVINNNITKDDFTEDGLNLQREDYKLNGCWGYY